MRFHLKLHHTILAVAVFLSASASRATTIAAVVTPENIVIAADTLVTKVSVTGAEGIGFAQKIETFGGTVVAAGGLAKAENNLFDVFKVVSEACRNSAGVNGQAQVFASLMRMKLPALGVGIRKQSANKGLLTQVNSTVWFCGLESGHPVIYAVESVVGLGVGFQSKVTMNRFPPYAFPRGTGTVFMGPNSLGGRHFELNPMRERDVPYLVGVAEEIVRAGIADPRGRSGGSVTLVQISKEGRISRSQR